MTLCPLCRSERSFQIRTFDIVTLREEWRRSYGFDPFPHDAGGRLVQRHCGECALRYFPVETAGDGAFYAEMSRRFDWYYPSDMWEFTEAIVRLSKNGSIRTLLEIGCGSGFFLEKVQGAYDALGIDINEEAARRCAEKGLNVLAVGFDSLRDQTFDAIVSFEVLEHLSCPAEFFSSAARMLKKGGALILAVPNPEGYLREFDHVLLDMPPHHVTSWRAETFAYAGTRHGFELVDMAYEPLRYDHYEQYLQMLRARNNITGGNGILAQLKSRLRSFVQYNVSRVVDPLSFQDHRERLGGQTQLVEFQKVKTS